MRGRRPTETTTISTSSGSRPSISSAVPEPSAAGLWPVTLAEVVTEMPRFLNERATTLAMSLSQPARMDEEPLDHRHLDAEVREERGELTADGAPADHRRAGREVVEVEELVRGQDQLAVDVESRKAPRDRAGSEDH